MGAFARSSLGWVAFSVAVALHLFVAATIAGVAIERSEGRHTPPPPILRLFNDVMHRLGPGADFFALYHAAVTLEGKGRIYDVVDDHVTPPFYSYRYLPSLAQSVGRLVRLTDPWKAYLGWIVLLEAALGLCLFLTWRLFRKTAPRLLPWLLALWLVYTPLWLELYMGQFSFLTGALLFLCGALAVSSSPRLSLLPWIASVAVKIYPVILLPLWWRRRWLLPAAGLLALLALANLPGFLTLPGAWRSFTSTNLSAPGPVWPDAGSYGFAYLLHLGSVRGLGVSEGVWPFFHRALGVLTLGFSLFFVASRRNPPVLPSLALLILAHQVSYKHVWEHHYTLVLPMGLFLLHHFRDDGRKRVAILAALVVLALPSPFVFWDRPGGDPGAGWPLFVQLAVPASKALPALLLFFVATTPFLVPEPERTTEARRPADAAAG